MSIWQDKWVPRLISLRPTTHIGNHIITGVSELIDRDRGLWNVDMVRHHFIAPEADAILNIPLRAGGGDDLWAWTAEKSGIYTMKSVYRSHDFERAFFSKGRDGHGIFRETETAVDKALEAQSCAKGASVLMASAKGNSSH